MITKLKLYHNQLKRYIMPKRIKPRRPYWLHDPKTDEFRMEMRPCTTKDLYRFYHMTRTAFETMIDPLTEVLGERRGHYFTVRQLEQIYDYVGPPYVAVIKWNEM